MRENEYDTGTHQDRFAALRQRGVTVGGQPASALSSGGQSPHTEATRNALAKAEAKALKAADAHLAVLADEDSPTADRDRAGVEDAKAQRALRAAAEAHVDAIEANAAAIEAWATAQADEAGTRAMEKLAEAREALQAFAQTKTLANAMRDRNPRRRLSPPTGGRLPGGDLVHNLAAIVAREVGSVPDYDRVSPEEMRRLQRGLQAETVDGRIVAELHPRVRVVYAPPLSGPQGAWA